MRMELLTALTLATSDSKFWDPDLVGAGHVLKNGAPKRRSSRAVAREAL
jgi:hypothetical protein